jgi:lactate racemase
MYRLYRFNTFIIWICRSQGVFVLICKEGGHMVLHILNRHMIIEFPYGKNNIKIKVPVDSDIIEPQFVSGISNPVEKIRESLRSPIGSKSLRNLFNPSDRIAIVHSDITRHTPNKIILPVIIKELLEAGAKEENIFFINATGSHRIQTQEELKGMLGADLVENFTCIQHDAFDRSSLVSIGFCDDNEILINKNFVEADFRIITGFIEPHFFAGFSGGPKAVMPGFAGIDTIMKNHSKEKIRNPNARWGVTAGNPLWEEINKAANFTDPLFMVNVALNSKHEITGVFSGAMEDAHKQGCDFVKNISMVPVKEEYDIVITSNSGYPLDMNLYQTVKGVSAASQIVKKNGVIIIVSECSEGLPFGSPFGDVLQKKESPLELHGRIMNGCENNPEQWQIQILADIAKEKNIYLYSDFIDNNYIHPAMIKKCKNIPALLNDLVAKDNRARICLLPGGPQTIPYLSSD